MSKSKKLNVVFAASESVPYAKTGGLADVIGALSAALVTKGVSVTVFLPFYSQIDRESLLLQSAKTTFSVPISDRSEKGRLYRGEYEGVVFYFIEQGQYFNRSGYYGTDEGDYPDNAERFLFFSRGVLEAVKVLGIKPDVFHCHDWHTGLIPLYLKTDYKDIFPKASSVFTIHNLGYQGVFWHDDWHLLNLPWKYFNAQGLEFSGKINFLKSGLLFADFLSTVSSRYAKEIQTPDYGHALEGVLKERRKELYGILNGIDTKAWNPALDPYIAAKYDVNNLTGKETCKRALQKEFGLPLQRETPLFAMITRLVQQKGIDLLEAVIGKLMNQQVQWVILGSGEKKFETLLQKCSEQFPDKMAIKITYDAPLAHRIEAGADIFLMPSAYEPCGLSQMMSLRYGTVPIVRATGGLDDTVIPFKTETAQGNGFKFKAYTATAFLRQIKRCLAIYKDKEVWKILMQNGMKGDYSWEASAVAYLKLYRTLRERKEQK
ncbi:glycogen synthase GlgA [Nitrospira defluvii]|nr:glycogen synthase GlgA [Nitrospira defluvii]